MEVPRTGRHHAGMHEAETRALRRAAIVLVLVSVLRWAWSERGPDMAVGAEGESVLPELIAASTEAADEEARRSRPLGQGERIDPNRADEIELDRLPGIGPSTARAIVAAREGGEVFRSADDLVAVRGIGPATVDRMRASLDFAVPMLPRRSMRGPRPGFVRASDARVDLNAASAEELQRLPGIGPALADRIVVARDKQVFTTVDDLVRVRGIGPATLERLRPLVTASGRP